MIPSNYLTATETQRLLRSGQLSEAQILADHVERFKARNGEIGAWVHVNHEASVMGSEKDREGRLHGVVLGVKDIMNTKDMPTEYGCPIYKGSQPGLDAAAVGICRAAGAAIIGKTTTTMFAASHVGPDTHNPFDTGHTPGGSSSGSAAAVSDYQCHISFGTQTGGSIIRPASFTGIFGFKPTWGTICKDGVKAYASTFDTIGFFARSVADIQLIWKEFNIVGDPSSSPGKKIQECRFGFVKTDQFENHASEDVKRVFTKAQSLLSSAGATVEEVDLGREFDGLIGQGGRLGHLTVHEARVNFLGDCQMDRSKLDPMIAAWVESEPPISARRFAEIQDEVAILRQKFDSLAGGYDAIIAPSALGEAPKGLHSTGDSRFCQIWTGLHIPAINVPGFAGSHGLPIGLSLIGPRYGDEKLLEMAKLVAREFIGADEGRLKKVPAPEGAIHVQE